MMRQKKSHSWNEVARFIENQGAMERPAHLQSYLDPIVLKKMGSLEGVRVLDVGSGTGYFSNLLARRGAKVTAIDSSLRMIKIATQIYSSSSELEFKRSNARDLGWLPNSDFDIVIAHMSIMDIAPARGFLYESGRILKSGGRLVLSMMHPFTENQPWVPTNIDGKEVVGRLSIDYLKPRPSLRRLTWGGGLWIRQYHRPLQSYVKWITAAGLAIITLDELPASLESSSPRQESASPLPRDRKGTDCCELLLKQRARISTPTYLLMCAKKTPKSWR